MASVDKLEAGPVLDHLIWERVFKRGKVTSIEVTKGCPHYSRDISAAWLVVEKMKPVWGTKFRLSFDDGEWELEPAWNSPVCGYGKTPALAICRAALNACAE
jgi:hypothetical protein